MGVFCSFWLFAAIGVYNIPVFFPTLSLAVLLLPMFFVLHGVGHSWRPRDVLWWALGGLGVHHAGLLWGGYRIAHYTVGVYGAFVVPLGGMALFVGWTFFCWAVVQQLHRYLLRVLHNQLLCCSASTAVLFFLLTYVVSEICLLPMGLFYGSPISHPLNILIHYPVLCAPIQLWGLWGATALYVYTGWAIAYVYVVRTRYSGVWVIIGMGLWVYGISVASPSLPMASACPPTVSAIAAGDGWKLLSEGGSGCAVFPWVRGCIPVITKQYDALSAHALWDDVRRIACAYPQVDAMIFPESAVWGSAWRELIDAIPCTICVGETDIHTRVWFISRDEPPDYCDKYCLVPITEYTMQPGTCAHRKAWQLTQELTVYPLICAELWWMPPTIFSETKNASALFVSCNDQWAPFWTARQLFGAARVRAMVVQRTVLYAARQYAAVLYPDGSVDMTTLFTVT